MSLNYNWTNQSSALILTCIQISFPAPR